MGGTQADLTKFFNEAINAFNHGQDMTPFLDANATVYSISHQQAYTPQHAAALYLKKQYQDHPKLTGMATSHTTLNTNGTGATIQGTATWKDDHYPKGEDVIFCCTFVYKNNRWLFSTLWAS
jgi:hypothetical protein